jgi:hypothetical protein
VGTVIHLHHCTDADIISDFQGMTYCKPLNVSFYHRL